MINVELNMREFNIFLRDFKNAPEIARNSIRRTLVDEGRRAVKSVEKRTPEGWDGLLKRSWTSEVFDGADSITLRVENSQLYASFVEEGHGNQAGRFVPGVWIGDRFKYIPYAGHSTGGMRLTGRRVKGKYFWRPVRRMTLLRARTITLWRLKRDLRRFS